MLLDACTLSMHSPADKRRKLCRLATKLGQALAMDDMVTGAPIENMLRLGWCLKSDLYKFDMRHMHASHNNVCRTD